MNLQKTKSYQRINITLPMETISRIDRVAPSGSRSRLVDQAVRFFLEETGRLHMRKRLKEGALMRAQRDSFIGEDWFLPEEELWRKDKK